jgi:hypothetical protein
MELQAGGFYLSLVFDLELPKNLVATERAIFAIPIA